MGVDHLNVGALDRFARRQSRTERSNALVSAAIGQGGVRVHSGGKITVENGGLNVTGIAEIHGQLNGDGTMTWVGDIVVPGTGRVIIGSLTFDTGGPYGAQVTAGATLLLNASSGIQLNSPITIVEGFQANLNANITGTFRNSGIPTTGSTANVYVDPTTKVFYRFSSSSVFKILPKEIETPSALLDVRMEAWVDRFAAERYAALLDVRGPLTEDQQREFDAPNTLKPIPGFIAQKVAAAGGDMFVGYDADGDVESFDSLNFGHARTQALIDEVAELRRELADLKAAVAPLLKR